MVSRGSLSTASSWLPRTQSAPGASGGGSTGTYSRPRDGRPAQGAAVERREAPRDGRTVIVGGRGYYGGFYPWGWGSIGIGGCVIDTAAGEIDARLDVQLDALMRALRTAVPDAA